MNKKTGLEIIAMNEEERQEYYIKQIVQTGKEIRTLKEKHNKKEC